MAFLAALFGARTAPTIAPAAQLRCPELTSVAAHRLSGLQAEAELGGDDDLLRDEPRRAYLRVLGRLPAIVEHAPQAVDDWCALIAEPTIVRALRIPPLAYLAVATALREATLGSSRGRLAALPPLTDPRDRTEPTRHRAEGDRALAAVGRAVDAALANLPELGGRTLVALDESHAMTAGRPGRRPIDVGALLAAALAKHEAHADVMRFADVARFRPLDATLPTLALAEELKSDAQRAGASIEAVFAAVARRRYDRIVILTDRARPRAALDAAAAAYRRRSGSDAYVHTIALAGAATLRVVGDRGCTVTGRIDGIIDVLREVERRGRDWRQRASGAT